MDLQGPVFLTTFYDFKSAKSANLGPGSILTLARHQIE